MAYEFRLKNINQARNYFIKEMKQNESMSKRHKEVCKVLNYIKHLFILASTVTQYIPISAFASLVSIPAGLASYTVGQKFFAMTAIIKKYKSMIKKKEKKEDIFLAKTKLNSI